MNRPEQGYSTDCRITRVIDGDTIEVEIVKRTTVRLIGCWAPESRTKDLIEKLKGLASKQHLLDSINAVGPKAHLFVPTTGDLSDMTTLGRVLGHVWLKDQDKSLSEIQVESGHAKSMK